MAKRKDLYEIFQEGTMPKSDTHSRNGVDVDRFVENYDIPPSELDEFPIGCDGLYEEVKKLERLRLIKEAHERLKKRKKKS
jgi:hypothetical protein